MLWPVIWQAYSPRRPLEPEAGNLASALQRKIEKQGKITNTIKKLFNLFHHVLPAFWSCSCGLSYKCLVGFARFRCGLKVHIWGVMSEAHGSILSHEDADAFAHHLCVWICVVRVCVSMGSKAQSHLEGLIVQTCCLMLVSLLFLSECHFGSISVEHHLWKVQKTSLEEDLGCGATTLCCNFCWEHSCFGFKGVDWQHPPLEERCSCCDLSTGGHWKRPALHEGDDFPVIGHVDAIPLLDWQNPSLSLADPGPATSDLKPLIEDLLSTRGMRTASRRQWCNGSNRL